MCLRLGQPGQPRIDLRGRLHGSAQRGTLGQQRVVQRCAGQQGQQGLRGNRGSTSLALRGNLGQGCGPGGQRGHHIGAPALRLLLQGIVLAHSLVELLAQAGKLRAALGVQQTVADGRPRLVQLDQVVEWHIGRAQQGGHRADQAIRSGARLPLGHCRVQPLAGDAVYPPVVAAEGPLGLAQRRLALQRLHCRQLGGQGGGALGDAQQRAVIAQCGLQLGQPQRLGGIGQAGAVISAGQLGLALVGLGGRSGFWCHCFGRCHRNGRRSLAATNLEKPAQHGCEAAGPQVSQSAGARRKPARGAV